jgi:putative addiction module killer protein
MHEIEEYVTEDGTSPFTDWLQGLKDTRTRMRLLARLDRASLGNLGDWKALSDAEGMVELRDHYGPGYRLYVSFVGRKIILLLGGSTKTGSATDDPQRRGPSGRLQAEDQDESETSFS